MNRPRRPCSHTGGDENGRFSTRRRHSPAAHFAACMGCFPGGFRPIDGGGCRRSARTGVARSGRPAAIDLDPD
ncbi:MAG: hypothetical protein M5U34_05925 [Chloroflexi bacterium]|nr:hypothetical protein [Chloroflexota bacterium]